MERCSFVEEMTGIFSEGKELKRFMLDLDEDKAHGFIMAAKALEVDSSIEARLAVLSTIYMMGRKHALH